jgi:hypothetical protein
LEAAVSTVLTEKSSRIRAPAWLLAVLLVVLASWVIGPSLSPRLNGHLEASSFAAAAVSALPGTQQAAGWPAAMPVQGSGLTLSAAWAQTTRLNGPGLGATASAVLAGTLLLGLVALLLAVTQRQLDDTVLAGACLLWAAHTAVGELTFFAAQRGLLQALLLGFCGLTGWYSLRVLDVPLQRGSTTLPAFGLVTVALLVWALGSLGAMDNTVGQILVMFMIVGMGLVLLAQVIDAAHRDDISLRHRQAAWAVALALSAALACLVHELGRLLGVASLINVALPAAGSTEATRWAVLALLTVLTGVRMDQVARSMRRMERSQRDARQHARQAQRSLQVTLDELHARERTDAQRLQRDRLLRELHDDIGQRVVRAIELTQPVGRCLTADGAVLARGPVAQQAAESGFAPLNGTARLTGRGALMRAVQLQGLLDAAMLDLRLALGSLDRANPVLADGLLDLCRHVEPLMKARGAGLQWQLAPATARLRIGAAETLQMLRIAQEVLVELLHDAHCAGDASLALDLLGGESGRRLRLQICGSRPLTAVGDDLSMPGPLPSYPDWASIRQRAQVLGAVVEEGRLPDGWGLEVSLPLGAPPAGLG